MVTEITEQIADKIIWASNDGCPVAPHSRHRALDMAAIALRRYSSFSKRNKREPVTTKNRIEDLANGLAEKYVDGGKRMAGLTIIDYRWLSEQIISVIG